MPPTRRLVAAAAALAVTGFALAGALGGVVTAAVTGLGNDYLVVAAVGVVALGTAVVVQVVRNRSGVAQAATPDVEDVNPAPHAGAELDAYLAGPIASGRVDPAPDPDPSRVRAGLRELAVAVERRESDCSRSAARRRVDAGAWTDDSAAAAYVRGARPTLGQRVRAALRAQSATRYGARCAARELDARTREGRR